MGENLADLGEFAAIDRLVGRLPSSELLLVAPGDDAALVAVRTPEALATADLLVEGRHFDLTLSRPSDVGFKALAVNVSDIAAMGGRPRFALVSLGAPGSTPTATLEELYDGLAEAARCFGVAVAGGDLVSAPSLLVSVALVGEPGEGGVVRRHGARPGDLLCVTGALGGATAGLALLRRADGDAEARSLLERFPGLARAHRRGQARVAEGIAAANAGARAMIDVSDGLAQDVGHLCRASALGAKLDAVRLPLAEGVEQTARWLGVDARTLAASGGDEYELAIALPPDRLPALRTAVGATPVHVVGEFADGEGVTLVGAELPVHGWDHFRRRD